jgi:hypothetical protein
MCHPQSSILSIPFGLGLVYSTWTAKWFSSKIILLLKTTLRFS